jgi:LPS export ABC transporter permease LptF/LPS export ABC transporter permease LptG
MRILNRYILRELVGPTLLGFAFYTFVILMRNLFDFAEIIIRRSLPLARVLEFLAYSLPHIVVLTLPMALLFGILIAIGRLSSDSEIIAMRAAGISTNAIYRPVLYFSALMFAITLFVINVITPIGNRTLVSWQRDLAATTIQSAVEPRVFYDDFEDLVVYVDDVDPATSEWKGVFVSNNSDPRQSVVTIAESGTVSRDEESGRLWLRLENASNHQYDPSKPQTYHVSQQRRQEISPPERDAIELQQRALSHSEMTVLQMLDAVRARPPDPRDERRLRVEIHKKFSIPFACIAFGIIALPLGITNRRGGRSSGVTLSIGIILVYYILLTNGEDMARQGTLPPSLAMWLPNIVLLVAGLILLRRTNRDIRSGGPDRLLHWIGLRISRFRRPRRRPSELVEEEQLIASRLDIAFPNTLDRYVLSEFLKVLAIVLLSTAVLFIVVDYTEKVDDISENRIPWEIVASYYRYLSIQVLDLILPLSVLVTTLITFGLFARNNEVTAMKAHGISLYRVTLPIILVASLISGLSYLLQDFVLPHSNERLHELENRIKGRERAGAFGEHRQWVFGGGRYLFNFLEFDRRSAALKGVQVFEFHPSEFRLSRRVVAEEARWDGVGWVFVNGWIRSFGDDQTRSFSPMTQPLRLHYPERPEYFSTEIRTPDQMTFAQLRRYIRDLRRSGYGASELTVELYRKTSWPFVSLVMALIALPFAFRMGKRGALYGIGIALFLAFFYWSIFGVFTQLGSVGNLPAILGAWSANILFIIAAVYMFLHVET